MNDVIRIIREELVLREQQHTYTIPELAATMKKLGYDDQGVKALQEILMDAYRKAGDEGVIDTYQQMAGVQIQALRQGRYVFADLGGGGEPMLEIRDNACHTPDEMPS